ncbi:hypothetical protein GLOIN_2v1486970 [Rhizophagus irregularis DAOM 181602=DAOM 197198]|uniref:Uncharacterized protein n=1 Tax=Rhizophagus irregularis (strain DAOM 181602 / DAOM 197198 / MUCL 43194) TaxID=747089 RepID=A0A2P4P560_RHIID|nr:hypothetical protein GLOIN_2v1486970 [Rhizophagus irregularis DAOM 181602=DAOM 197198]POG60513.1 hypothetical protein GLOIN_2v1486970 [Rhizophagus irregularis DAOM 181602=DAOM 197198]|eukprot:XP_025167379.1 hypothetical protein GLOIN_2v1486970 [Rhizophagus irregularis DAOM 181602=DAOM 197198]
MTTKLNLLLAEIAELRKENAEIPELREKLLKFAEVEAENAKLKQIIEENARRDSENAELKSRVGELEARLALLEQGSAVDGMALSFGQTQNDKEAMPVVTVPTVDVPDSVIDQLNNEVERAPSDLRYVKNMSCIQIKQKTSIVWKPMYVWCHMYAMYGNDFIHERLNIFLVRGKSFV